MLTLWMNTFNSNSGRRPAPAPRGHYVYFYPGWPVIIPGLVATLAQPHTRLSHPHVQPRSMLQKALASVA